MECLTKPGELFRKVALGHVLEESKGNVMVRNLDFKGNEEPLEAFEQ